MNMMDAVRSGFRRYAQFSGRCDAAGILVPTLAVAVRRL